MDKKKIADDYNNDRDAIRTIVDGFDEKESMLISKIEDSVSPDFKSRVTDSRLSTIIWERSGRVMGQLPKGIVKALTRADKGKSLLMDIVLQRYIAPNANSQYSHLIKLRMWDLYSMVYGMMPMMVDYRVDDAYIGPDSWLIPIRNFVPQRGKLSINDSDYCHIDNYVSAGWLKKKLEDDGGGWNSSAIRKVLSRAEQGTRTKRNDTREESYVERTRTNDVGSAKGKYAQIKLTTRYEKGADSKWVTFAPDFDNEIVRELSNPHNNGKIPVVLKHCFPLIDSIYGLGDFERGKTLQYAMDSLINLYLDGVKMSIFPPTVVNPNGVVPSTLRFSPGARWLETIPNSIRSHAISPQGLTTFQSTYSFLIGSMLNQNGTTDTATNADNSSDPGFGKTPEALKMLAARENTRDNWDRFMMEEAVEELYDYFINLTATKQPKAIDLRLFGDEIEQIKEVYPDIGNKMEVSDSRESAKLTLDTRELGGKDIEYKYYIDAGSTLKKDNAEQAQQLTNMLIAVSKIPGLQQVLQQEGMKYNVGEHLKRIFATSGVDDYDKIIYPMTEDDAIAQQQAQANLNQPPQGNMGGEIMPPTMAESQAQMGTPPADQAGNPDFAYVPQKLSAQFVDPEIRQVADEMFKE